MGDGAEKRKEHAGKKIIPEPEQRQHGSILPCLSEQGLKDMVSIFTKRMYRMRRASRRAPCQRPGSPTNS
jgi:hypothetical protein